MLIASIINSVIIYYLIHCQIVLMLSYLPVTLPTIRRDKYRTSLMCNWFLVSFEALQEYVIVV